MSKKKSGVGHTMPKGEARPLGTKAAKRAAKLLTYPSAEKTSVEFEKAIDSPAPPPVESSQSSAITPTQSTSVSGATTMEVTLTRDPKPRKSTSIVYNGAGIKGGVRLSKSAFANGSPDESITLVGNFAAPKPKETKEERKVRLAAAPKPTLAEKIEKRRKALAALEAKAAAGASL